MNWASGPKFRVSQVPEKTVPEFEQLAAKLKLPEPLWQDSTILKKFAKRNCNFKYVPENLLKQWGIEPRILL